MDTSNFLKEYNFNTFVVGNSNRFAHAVAVAASKNFLQNVICFLYMVKLDLAKLT